MAENDGFAMGYALGQDNNGSNNNGSMWGMDWIWAIIILAMFWGNNGFGGFGGGSGGALTRSDLCDGFNFQNLENGVRGVQQGLCDGFYAVNTSLMNGFHGVDNAVCTLGYQTQQGFNSLAAQMASCCCDTQRAIDGVNYNMATNTCALQNTMNSNTRDIIDNQNAGTRAILDYLCQDKISSLQAENQSLKLAASQAAQNAFITANQEAQTAELIRRIAPSPVPSYQVPAPYPYCGGSYSNFGCGCNSGCGF